MTNHLKGNDTIGKPAQYRHGVDAALAKHSPDLGNSFKARSGHIAALPANAHRPDQTASVATVGRHQELANKLADVLWGVAPVDVLDQHVSSPLQCASCQLAVLLPELALVGGGRDATCT